MTEPPSAHAAYVASGVDYDELRASIREDEIPIGVLPRRGTVDRRGGCSGPRVEVGRRPQIVEAIQRNTRTLCSDPMRRYTA